MTNISSVEKDCQSVIENMQNTNSVEGTSTIPSLSTQQVRIEYKEGQWSPCNKDGSKVYERTQLLILRNSVLSRRKPTVSHHATPILRYIPTKINQNRNPLLPSFVSDKRLPMVGAFQVRKSASYEGTSRMPDKSSCKDPNAGMIRVSLSLCKDVELKESTNAWRPLHLRPKTDDSLPEDTTDQLVRKVRGILNKLAPEKFDILVQQVTSLQIDTSEKIIAVMELIFEKAIDEPNFSATYAKLCSKLIESKLQTRGQDANLDIFRKALLGKTEKEFKENVLSREAKDCQLRPITEQLTKCPNPEEELELRSTLDEQERKLRRRFVGTVKFIGELFKINILTQRILTSCIESLLDADDEDKLECLCQLLRTVGEVFENGRNLDHTVAAMKQIVERKEVSSRIRFMLQDVIDLHNEKWKTKDGEGLTTVGQIRKEVDAENTRTRMLNFHLESNKRDERPNNSCGGQRPLYVNRSGGQSTSSMAPRERYRNNNNFNKNKSENRQLNMGKGKCFVDANKLGRLIISGNENARKLGTRSQFQWNPGEGTSRACSSSFDLPSNVNSSTGNSAGSTNKPSHKENTEDHSEK